MSEPRTPARTRGGRRSIRRSVLTGLGLAAVALLLLPSLAGAQDAKPIPVTGQEVNLLWTVIGAVLVIFMQAGFALVETGFCRAKHAAHVVSTNFAIFGLGFVAYYFVGYAFMFGGYSNSFIGMDQAAGSSLIGSGNWTFLWKGGFALTDMRGSAGAAALGFFLYMVAFMDTTATIPTGAMAERWKWKAFVGWGLFCGAIYYPLFGAWTWGGGWLAKLGDSAQLGLGYVDFAGSGVVHAVGGVAGLAGALVLGPRIGKYNKDGSANTLPGHHIPMAFLGTFILLFGWFGFNAASTLAATDVQFATVATNTAIAAAFGATVAMFIMMMKGDKKPDPGMMANGMLAGLVAITAPCAFVDPWAAAVIGTIAAGLVIVAIGFFEKRGIDDPVGAISVHGVCGLWGVLSVGIFANGSYGAGWNATTKGAAAKLDGVVGILGGNFSVGLRQLGAQAIGALVICTVIFGLAFAFFKIQNAVMKGGIRSERADELEGLDMPEMGMLAYPEFEPAKETVVVTVVEDEKVLT
jgi:ammonium transporter, Amt family